MHGPIFGAGPDLEINLASIYQSGSQLGHSYALPSGCYVISSTYFGIALSGLRDVEVYCMSNHEELGNTALLIFYLVYEIYLVMCETPIETTTEDKLS